MEFLPKRARGVCVITLGSEFVSVVNTVPFNGDNACSQQNRTEHEVQISLTRYRFWVMVTFLVKYVVYKK